MRALTQDLDRRAAQLGCGAIRATVLSDGSPAEAGLRAAGLHRHGSTLWKRLPGGASAAAH